MKALVLGLGWIARRVHIPALLAHPEISSVMVSDTCQSAVLAATRDFGVLPDASVLESSDADLVVICTPPHLHADLAVQALAAGKDVLLEKPMALSGADAARIMRTAEATGRRFGVCYTNRFRQDVETLIELALDGTLGELIFIRGSWLRRNGVPATTGARAAGVLWDLGAHLADIVVGLVPQMTEAHVLGKESAHASPADVSSGWYRAPHGASTDERPVSATRVRASVLPTAGPTAHLDVAWSSPVPHDLVTFDVVGSEATAHLRTVFGFSPARQAVEGPPLVVVKSGSGLVVPVVTSQERAHLEYEQQLTRFLGTSTNDLALDAAQGARGVHLLEGIAASIQHQTAMPVSMSSIGRGT